MFKSLLGPRPTVTSMNETTTDALPVFPTEAPPVFGDPEAIRALFRPVLTQLASIVELPDGQLDGPTPCQAYTVAELRRHTLAWLQFFAAALNDPEGTGDRPDPETWDLSPQQAPGEVVAHAAADIERAVDAGAAGSLVVMAQARMEGAGVLAMALGEYQVHGWDLAVATGQRWEGDDAAAEPALAFLQTTVAPEYRGPDSGMFGDEVEPPDGASAFVRLLCFTGRNPAWAP